MDDKSDFKTFIVDDTEYKTLYTAKFEKRNAYTPPDPNLVLAYIPGVILKIHVAAGRRIQRGDSLLILEAMKMKNDVLSPRDGVVKHIFVEQGQMVGKNQRLLEFE